MTRVTIVSDTHVSDRVPETLVSWAAVHDHVARRLPDLVLHLGDLSLDGARGPDDLALARLLLDDLPAPWAAVPGNHDVGDTPPATGAVEGVVDEGKRQRWQDHIGPAWWSRAVDGWHVVGVDAQLLGSGLAAEEAQWAWLEDELAGAAGHPTVVLSHKPTAAPPGEGHEGPGQRFVPRAARDRLARALDGGRVPLVISGHVHQARHLDLGGRRHLWVPTAWAVLPEQVQATVGAKRCAIVDLDLSGGDRWTTTEVVPPGMRQLTVSVDLPNPYL